MLVCLEVNGGVQYWGQDRIDARRLWVRDERMMLASPTRCILTVKLKLKISLMEVMWSEMSRMMSSGMEFTMPDGGACSLNTRDCDRIRITGMGILKSDFNLWSLLAFMLFQVQSDDAEDKIIYQSCHERVLPGGNSGYNLVP